MRSFTVVGLSSRYVTWEVARVPALTRPVAYVAVLTVVVALVLRENDVAVVGTVGPAVAAICAPVR
jgi:uncharacterized membrane protein